MDQFPLQQDTYLVYMHSKFKLHAGSDNSWTTSFTLTSRWPRSGQTEIYTKRMVSWFDNIFYHLQVPIDRIFYQWYLSDRMFSYHLEAGPVPWVPGRVGCWHPHLTAQYCPCREPISWELELETLATSTSLVGGRGESNLWTVKVKHSLSTPMLTSNTILQKGKINWKGGVCLRVLPKQIGGLGSENGYFDLKLFRNEFCWGFMLYKYANNS